MVSTRKLTLSMNFTTVSEEGSAFCKKNANGFKFFSLDGIQKFIWRIYSKVEVGIETNLYPFRQFCFL